MDTELDEKAVGQATKERFWKEIKRWIPAAVICGGGHGLLFWVIAGKGIGIVGGIIVAYLVLNAGWASHGMERLKEISDLQYMVLEKRIANLRREFELRLKQQNLSEKVADQKTTPDLLN